MPIGAMIAGAAGLAQLGIGASQYFKGKKQERELERPDYTPETMNIPESVYQKEALGMAQGMAQQGLPEQQRQQYIQNLQRGTSYGLGQLGSRKAGLTGLATLNEQQNQGYQNLLAQDASARMANQQNLMNLQAQTGRDVTQAELQKQSFDTGQREQAFQFNQVNPYYEGVSQARGLMGSGMQNIGTGLGNASQLAGSGAFDGLGGGGGAKTATTPLTNTQPVNPMSGSLSNPAPLNYGATPLMPDIGQLAPTSKGLNFQPSNFR